ncbi:MAG TPA: PepSY domain-containing protein [Gaiellaceae bacterium]|nr:PepSY domain-containing protein [Gaiellaceae bacterium]
MTVKVKNTALLVSSLAALALGGSAIAGAASNDTAASSDAATTQDDDSRARGQHRQRADETPLTGDTASKVRAAALARVDGGAIERVETDADGHAAYEAHMTKADGSRVTVYVNAQFEVVSVESGR